MKLKTILLTTVATGAFMCEPVIVHAVNSTPDSMGWFRKKKKSEPNDSVKSKNEYEKLTGDGSIIRRGMFNVYQKKNDYYFEVPTNLLGRDMLVVNKLQRVPSELNEAGVNRGTNYENQMVRFELDKATNKLLIRQSRPLPLAPAEDAISQSVRDNYISPLIAGFKIEAFNNDSTTMVIKVNDIYDGTETSINNVFTNINLGTSSIKNLSRILSIKSFENNVVATSELTTKVTEGTTSIYVTVEVSSSLMLLPETPMTGRLDNARVGYFTNPLLSYSDGQQRVSKQQFITRWRLEPKPEDRERYLRGELVEPAKPIVFYIENSTPYRWRKYIKQGIEDWNTAFEAAGFKNAIQARDYPKNDPDFDPDDMRYSCVKYAATTIANAMGPSFVDPRSGEILTADVIWYHNIVSLLHNWRFCQTAATDPRVRKPVFDDDVMRESMRYVTSHEIGHTLGLMHNMGASYAYPVDSLRSPSFTQKYGTTPSIMDYARNNYIAQPGDFDRGVKLTPPILGVYDIYAIAWGYRLIPGANTPAEEVATLTQWIEEKKADPMYEFGAQQFMAIIDPSDQTEDLSNDHLRAGDYAISNLKIIMSNLEKWAAEPGKPYDDLDEIYDQLVKQYTRHIGHVMTYIGGVEFKDARQGGKNAARTHLDRATQKKAMQWLMRQARTYNNWLTPTQLMMKLDRTLNCNDNLRRSIVGCLLNSTALYRIEESGLVNNRKNYTLDTYLDDALAELFKASYQGKKLDAAERDIQSAALAVIIKYSGLTPSSGKKTSSAKAFSDYQEVVALGYSPDVPCSHTACEANREEEVSFLRINMGQPGIANTRIAPLMTAHLKKIESLYKQQRARTNDKTTRDFYDYQLMQIKELFN